MLTYSAPLQIQHLSKRLQLLQEDKFKSYRGLVEQQAEAEWKLYELLSELIMLSDDPGFPSLEKMKEFHSTYPEKNLVSIDDLLSKFWIRIILGKVEIPSAIGSSIRDIDKGEPKYIEIIQILSNEIKNSAKKGLEQIELETLVNQFNNSHPDLFISLKEVEEHITGKTFKTNLHVLKAYSHYRLLLYDNKTQFQFIKLFCEKYNGGGLSSYSIPTRKANFAIEKHRKLYGKCPCLGSLIESGFLETKNDTVVIRHNYGEKNGSFTISSQTAAYVWEKLLAKNLDQNRAALLMIWLDKLVINQNYPIDCVKFLSPFAKHELITAAKEVIFNEQDIKNIEDELSKLWFDERFSHHYERLVFPIKETFKITQDSASTYRLILELEERQHQMFHDQHSRWRLSLLIHILFNLGEPHENPRFAFPEIIELLRQSKNRPFILYKVCILIEHQRPEIIPYLLCEQDFAELGMLLVNKIKLSNYSVRYTERAEIGLSINMLKQELTHEAFISLLNYSCIHQNMVTASKIIARALSDKAKELFYMPFNYNQRDERQKNIYLKAYNDLWDVLITYQRDDNTFSEFGREKPLFILSIYQHLIAAMLEDDNSYGRNELFSPPLWRFEVLIKMLKTLKNPSIFNKAILNESYQIYIDTKGSLINEIQKSYKHLFTVKKVLVRSDSISDIEERDVIYRSNYLGINWVEWRIYIESLSPTQREEFYNAANTSISLSGFDDKWDVKLNEDIEAKIGLIRFHLQVMIACHNTVQDLPSDDTVLRQGLEQHITRLFCEHYRLDIPNNKIDIFDKDENGLLEDILGISNEFQPHSRDMIVNTVISYPEFLDRVFIALNILISENDLRALQSAINAEAVDAYLTNAWGQQKAQYLLVSAINNIDLAHIAQQIVNHIEDRSSTSIYYQQSQVQLFLYHIKLVLADRLNDRLMLESLTLPEAQVHFTSEMREAEDDKKRFFIIRADWRSGNLANALRETEQIALRRKDNADFIFMRFDLQLENAMIEFKNDTTRRLKAIKEAYELLIRDESDTYYYTPIKSIAYKKLKVFHLLQWGEHFDSAYFLIKRADRFFPDIAALKIDNCINRKRWAEATDFLRELENFHKNRYQDIPDFVEILRDKVSSQKEFLPYLKDAYKSILTLTAEERIKALPSVISPFTNEYGKFLLNELFVAALALQEKFFATLKDTDDLKTMKEDNITDFFETILNARLGMIGLHWQCQNRAGRSDKTNALQRSDLSLKSGNALRVLEALRVYSSQTLNAAFPNIEDHILKSFDQTSSRKDFYCVIYYQASSFDKDWPLLLYAVNKIAFPERFKLMEEAKEISESSSSDIKTAYSTHGGGVTHYYMLVNLRYPVNEII